MPKYAAFFTYTNDAWNRMIDTPGDRTAAIRQILSSLGGSLESVYWMLGAHDGIAIFDVPDSVSAAAVRVAVEGSGAVHSETYELFDQDQLAGLLERAKTARGAFQPPGQQH